MAFEVGTTVEVIKAYVERFSAPSLKVRRIGVMDNLWAHKPDKVRKLIEGGP